MLDKVTLILALVKNQRISNPRSNFEYDYSYTILKLYNKTSTFVNHTVIFSWLHLIPSGS